MFISILDLFFPSFNHHVVSISCFTVDALIFIIMRWANNWSQSQTMCCVRHDPPQGSFLVLCRTTKTMLLMLISVDDGHLHLELEFTANSVICNYMKCSCSFQRSSDIKRKGQSFFVQNCSDIYIQAGLLWGSNECAHFMSRSWTFSLNHLVNVCIKVFEHVFFSVRTEYWKTILAF